MIPFTRTRGVSSWRQKVDGGSRDWGKGELFNGHKLQVGKMMMIRTAVGYTAV